MEEEESHSRNTQVERKWGCETLRGSLREAAGDAGPRSSGNVEAGSLKTHSGYFDLCNVGSGVFVCLR